MQKARESVSVAILPSEASRIALFMSDGNAEAHASICNIRFRFNTPHGAPAQKAVHYITTGIYRCSILDMNKKSLRDISDGQESARINAF